MCIHRYVSYSFSSRSGPSCSWSWSYGGFL
jgi:hypothetical protein